MEYDTGLYLGRDLDWHCRWCHNNHHTYTFGSGQGGYRNMNNDYKARFLKADELATEITDIEAYTTNRWKQVLSSLDNGPIDPIKWQKTMADVRELSEDMLRLSQRIRQWADYLEPTLEEMAGYGND
jgi:pyruvate-formate lyase-activating enzyme